MVLRGWRPAYARLAVLVALVTAVTLVAVSVGLPTVATLRHLTDAHPVASRVVFVAGYAAYTVAPLPKSVLSLAAGATFGLAGGLPLVYAGALLGAAGSFLLGRGLGRDAVERLLGDRAVTLRHLVERRGVVVLLVARLVPLVPFTLLNFAASVARISRRDFAVATAVGIVPGTVAYVAAGAYATRPGSWQFDLAVVALLLLAVAGFVTARRVRDREPTPGDRVT